MGHPAGPIVVGPYRGKSTQAKACATAKQCKPRPYKGKTPTLRKQRSGWGTRKSQARGHAPRLCATRYGEGACQAAEEEMEPASSSDKISRRERIKSSREIWLRRNWMRKWYAESGE